MRETSFSKTFSSDDGLTSYTFYFRFVSEPVAPYYYYVDEYEDYKASTSKITGYLKIMSNGEYIDSKINNNLIVSIGTTHQGFNFNLQSLAINSSTHERTLNINNVFQHDSTGNRSSETINIKVVPVNDYTNVKGSYSGTIYHDVIKIASRPTVSNYVVTNFGSTVINTNSVNSNYKHTIKIQIPKLNSDTKDLGEITIASNITNSYTLTLSNYQTSWFSYLNYTPHKCYIKCLTYDENGEYIGTRVCWLWIKRNMTLNEKLQSLNDQLDDHGYYNGGGYYYYDYIKMEEYNGNTHGMFYNGLSKIKLTTHFNTESINLPVWGTFRSTIKSVTLGTHYNGESTTTEYSEVYNLTHTNLANNNINLAFLSPGSAASSYNYRYTDQEEVYLSAMIKTVFAYRDSQYSSNNKAQYGNYGIADDINFRIHEYVKPSINSYSCYRVNSSDVMDENGTYAHVRITCSIGTVFDYCQRNYSTLKMYYKLSTSSSYSSYYTFYTNSVDNTITIDMMIPGITFNALSTYDIKFVLTDRYGYSVEHTVSLLPPDVLIDYNKSGKSIAFGKISEAESSEKIIETVMPIISLSSYNRNTSWNGYQKGIINQKRNK